MMKTNHNILSPILGVAQLVRGNAYIVHEKAIVGECYTIVCPKCNKQLLLHPDKKGAHIEVCSNCKAQIGYNSKIVVSKEEGTDDLHTEINRMLLNKDHAGKSGRLVWGFLGRHSANLSVGENIVGRKDTKFPSDISIDDAYISRRSISIDVEEKLGAYSFKLTVLKAANPIMVNSNELHVGNSIYLNYGDTIKLGNTVLTFKKAKK